MCINIEEEEGGEGCVSFSSQHMGDVLTCGGLVRPFQQIRYVYQYRGGGGGGRGVCPPPVSTWVMCLPVVVW